MIDHGHGVIPSLAAPQALRAGGIGKRFIYMRATANAKSLPEFCNLSLERFEPKATRV
jgi:hypothetical protein